MRSTMTVRVGVVHRKGRQPGRSWDVYVRVWSGKERQDVSDNNEFKLADIVSLPVTKGMSHVRALGDALYYANNTHRALEAWHMAFQKDALVLAIRDRLARGGKL